MIKSEFRPDRENNIAGRRKHRTIAAEHLSYYPLNPVPANRTSRLPGDTDAQPAFRTIVGEHDEAETVSPDSPAVLINPLEFPGLFYFS